ncbi:MAG: hypothetical protein DRJ45_06145 [Thermoprotei archaeon]|nr:MAG: hypothetical protein DRJ45_06145 [Thermoprotei archaeon]
MEVKNLLGKHYSGDCVDIPDAVRLCNFARGAGGNIRCDQPDTASRNERAYIMEVRIKEMEKLKEVCDTLTQ